MISCSRLILWLLENYEAQRIKGTQSGEWRTEKLSTTTTTKNLTRNKNLQLSLRESANSSYKETKIL